MLFNPSTSLPGECDDQERSLSPWASDTLFPEYVFPNNGLASSEHLPVASVARATTRWEQQASHAVDPQLLVDVSVKKRQNTFDADGFEQVDVSACSDTAATVFLTRHIVDQDSTTRASPQYPIGTNSDIPSPSTLSSGTVASRSPAAIDRPIHVVQYNPTKWQKKSEPQCKRPTKPRSKEGRQRALSSRLNALETDKAPKTSVKRDAHGKITGTETVFGLNQVVRAPVSGESQLATSITRRVGACLRCRQHRTRCDRLESVYQPCSRCVRLVANLQHQPCIRASILDLRLHRKGPTLSDDLHIWVRGKQLIANDAQHGDTSHVFFLTQGFGEGLENALGITVSRFEPGPGDRTTYHWVDPSGQHRTMEMPPYFISDLEAARQSIRQFLHNVRSIYIDTLLADSNPIVHRTFQAALTYRAFNQSQLVSVALDVWVAARLIEAQWRVFCGGAMIGLGPVDEPGHPWHDFTPVTPIMDTQLDDLVIRDLIAPLTQEFLKRLKGKIDERKKENWLEIYFAIFIMMSNIGWTVKDMVANATWKGLKPGSRGGTLTQGFIHACKTMLSYFHFACNGSAPVSICFSELSASNRDDKGVTPDQIEYLSTIQQDITRQGSRLSKWKEMSLYEDDEIYWCFQMLCEGWRGDIPYLGEVDDFTEQDFLSSSGT